MTTDDLFAGKNVIVFSLPGAFTPISSSTHLPRYNELAPGVGGEGHRFNPDACRRPICLKAK